MKIILIILLLIGFTLVHLIKLMRLYLIMMEERVPLGKFIPAYLRTTLVNLIIPFKLGEVFRMWEFSRLSGGFRTGFFSVLIDRFFDTLAIVLLLLPCELLVTGKVSLPAILLTVFLVIIVFAYCIFPSTYTFLNRYIIMNRSSKSSMTALKGLEIVHEWYEYVKKLVMGRYGLLILMSLAAWLFEIMVISGFARLYGAAFKVADFGIYIESIISGSGYALKREYTLSGIVVMLIATICFTIYYRFRDKSRNR